MDKYTIAPPAGSTNNSVGAEDRPWHEGHFDSVKLNGGDLGSYLAESTGYGIVSGCEPSISGLTVTVASGVVHLADGTRKEIAETNITLDAADSTNPRIDLVYIDSTGTVAKITGTASASPVVPSVPSGGICVCNVTITAGAVTGTVAAKRKMVSTTKSSIYNVADWGIYPNGDIVAPKLQEMVDYISALGGGVVQFNPGTYNLGAYLDSNARPQNSIDVKSNVWFVGNGTTIKGNLTGDDYYALFWNSNYNKIPNNICFENLIFDAYNDSVPYVNGDWRMPIIINSAKDVIVRNCTFIINSMAIETRSGSTSPTVINDRNAGRYHIENWLIENNKFVFQIKSNLAYYDNTTVGLIGRNITFRKNKFSVEITTNDYNKVPNCCVEIMGQDVFVVDNIFDGYTNACDIVAGDTYTGRRNFHFERNIIRTSRGVMMWNNGNHMDYVFIKDNLFIPQGFDTAHNQYTMLNMVGMEIHLDSSKDGYYSNIFIENNNFDYTDSYNFFHTMNATIWNAWQGTTAWLTYGGEYTQFFSTINLGAFTSNKESIFVENNTFIKPCFPCLWQSKSYVYNLKFDRNTIIDGCNGASHYIMFFKDYANGVSICDNLVVDTNDTNTPLGRLLFNAQPGTYADATDSRFFNFVILNNKYERSKNNTVGALTLVIDRLLLWVDTQTLDYYEKSTAGNPNYIPRKAGLLCKDSNGNLFMSTGSTAVSDWLKINNG